MERRDSAPNLPIFSTLHNADHGNDRVYDDDDRIAAFLRRSSLPLEVLASELSLTRDMESAVATSSSNTTGLDTGIDIPRIGNSDRLARNAESDDGSRDKVSQEPKQSQPGYRSTSFKLRKAENYVAHHLHYSDTALYRNASKAHSKIVSASALPSTPIISSPFIAPATPSLPSIPSYEGFYYHTPALPFHAPSLDSRQYPYLAQRRHHQQYSPSNHSENDQRPFYYAIPSPLRESGPSGNSFAHVSPQWTSPTAGSISAYQTGYITPPKTQRISRSTSTKTFDSYPHVTPPRRNNSFSGRHPQLLNTNQQRPKQPRYVDLLQYQQRSKNGNCDIYGSDNDSDTSLESIVSTKFRDTTYVLWVGNLPIGAGEGLIRDQFAGIEIKEVDLHVETASCFLALASLNDLDRALQYDSSVLNGNEIKVCKLSNKKTPSRKAQQDTPNTSYSPSKTINPHCSSSLATRLFATPPRSPAHELGDPLGRNEREGEFKYEDRYFIMKSLSLEDLEIARERGYWATQAKNETILNRAYHDTRNVYLVFSANKSGEFYGCARMESGIEGVNDAKLATSLTAVSLSVRGTTSEINHDPSFEDGPCEQNNGAVNIEWAPIRPPPFNHDHCRTEEYVPPKWGSPFRIRWLVIHPLPFQQTKHLRNSWNANKQVKVSRDGTEVETTAGRRIIQEFQFALLKSSMVKNHNASEGSSSGGHRTANSETTEMELHELDEEDSTAEGVEEPLTTAEISYSRMMMRYQPSSFSPVPQIGNPAATTFFETTHLQSISGICIYPATSSPALAPEMVRNYYSPTM